MSTCSAPMYNAGQRAQDTTNWAISAPNSLLSSDWVKPDSNTVSPALVMYNLPRGHQWLCAHWILNTLSKKHMSTCSAPMCAKFAGEGRNFIQNCPSQTVSESSQNHRNHQTVVKIGHVGSYGGEGGGGGGGGLRLVCLLVACLLNVPATC